jgi:thiosulfate/3-mercaptopyruvate sulfurtransferase
MTYANEVLVSTDWVAQHGDDRNVVVAEVDENTDLYAEGHIAGAVALHWKAEMQQQVVRDVVTKDEFERLLASKGISNGTTVVLYGDRNNWFAAYAYWYLKLHGHDDARIMDGGRQKWIDEGRQVSQATAYCRIGERSSHTWFVLRELLGYPDVRNYDGSWTEWGNLVDVPIVKGSDPG